MLLVDAGSLQRHSLPRLYGRTSEGDPRGIYTRKDRKNHANRISEMEHFTLAMPKACRYGIEKILDQVRGAAPVHDDDGNVLTGQPALEKRGDIYDEWMRLLGWNHPINGVTLAERRYAFILECTVSELNELHPNLDIAKQQLLERVEDAITARCRFLFDRDTDPSNQAQRDAKDAMLKERQVMSRSLRTATTLAAAQTAHNAAVAAVNAVSVAGAPSWSRDGGEPLSDQRRNFHAAAYTKGTGKNKWVLPIHAHTAARSNAASRERGLVLLDSFTHPEFEVANISRPRGGWRPQLRHPAQDRHDRTSRCRQIRAGAGLSKPERPKHADTRDHGLVSFAGQAPARERRMQ